MIEDSRIIEDDRLPDHWIDAPVDPDPDPEPFSAPVAFLNVIVDAMAKRAA